MAARWIAATLALTIASCASAPSGPNAKFPSYSSFSSAPDGTLALYQTLAKTPGVRVDRAYAPPNALRSEETRLILGLDVFSWLRSGDPTLESEDLVRDGGRLVIGFLPVRTTKGVPWVQHWLTSWNMELDLGELDSWGAPPGLRSGLRLSSRGSWMPIITHGALAEAAEKSFGRGTIVLVSDAFSLSNAAMRDPTQVLIRSVIVGNSTLITFDEDRFGSNETGNIHK